MNDFSIDELEEIVKAIKETPEDSLKEIPLRPPGSYGTISKLSFSPIEGDRPLPLDKITDVDLENFENVSIKIDAVFGQTKMSLRELAALKPGKMIVFDDLCDDLVDLYVNDTRIARGEIVAVDGQFGVKILFFTKN